MRDEIVLSTNILYKGTTVRTVHELMRETLDILLSQLKRRKLKSFTVRVEKQMGGAYLLEVLDVEESD